MTPISEGIVPLNELDSRERRDSLDKAPKTAGGIVPLNILTLRSMDESSDSLLKPKGIVPLN